MARNTLLPHARQACEHLRDIGEPLTVGKVRAHLERDVPSYRQLMAAVNPDQAARALMGSAIATVLNELPAYPSEDGFIHVDVTREQRPEVWEKLIAYRSEQVAHLSTSLQELENLRDKSVLHEQVEMGAESVRPVEASVEH